MQKNLKKKNKKKETSDPIPDCSTAIQLYTAPLFILPVFCHLCLPCLFSALGSVSISALHLG